MPSPALITPIVGAASCRDSTVLNIELADQ